jgi:hypothetical protein
MIYTGMPSPDQMPQQIMLPPQEIHPPRDMTIDVMGIRVPAEMLDSGTFWLFLAVCVATVLGVAYLKYARKDAD